MTMPKRLQAIHASAAPPSLPFTGRVARNAGRVGLGQQTGAAQ